MLQLSNFKRTIGGRVGGEELGSSTLKYLLYLEASSLEQDMGEPVGELQHQGIWLLDSEHVRAVKNFKSLLNQRWGRGERGRSSFILSSHLVFLYAKTERLTERGTQRHQHQRQHRTVRGIARLPVSKKEAGVAKGAVCNGAALLHGFSQSGRSRAFLSTVP